MGNSTTTLQATVDMVAAMADVSPQANPGGFAVNTMLTIANDVMNDLIAKRFNWKWNRANAPAFLTNSWQQDYPMLGLTNIGWIESGYWVDINNTVRPKPIDQVYPAKDISVIGGRIGGPPHDAEWLYNGLLAYGTWPGPGQVYNALTGPGVSNPPANPPMAFIDANGNILTLTTFGTTGATAPQAPPNSAEGTNVADGTAGWTVCAPMTQGFRVTPLPPEAGPVYQVNLAYQMRAPMFTSMQQTLNPIPDDYAHYFRRGYKAYCYAYATDPKTRAQFPPMQEAWLAGMEEAEKQGDREPDIFGLIPATQVVESRWGFSRNPRDPSRPY